MTWKLLVQAYLGVLVVTKSDVKIIVDVNSYILYSTRKSDKKFKIFEEKVLKRDNYTCSYCTFKANKHMTVINNDCDYRNNSLDNLVTACPFCAQAHFLPFIGKVPSTGGVLIHMPDITQADLNALCHVLFCVIQHQAKYHNNAEKIYKSLKLRSKLIDDCWGNSLSDPAHFAQMLIDTPLDKIKSVQSQLIQNIRILPRFKAFSNEINDWSNNALEQGIAGF